MEVVPAAVVDVAALVVDVAAAEVVADVVELPPPRIESKGLPLEVCGRVTGQPGCDA